MTDPNSMDTDDDPVVKEIPMYLSRTLAEKLFVFQYPIKPASEGYDASEVLSSAIKPQNQEVKIDISIDPNGPNYDRRKGEQIALNADGPGKPGEENNKEPIFNNKYMDKMVIQSTRALTDTSNFGIGVYQDGELHVTPLHGFLQLRPQFDYLDASEKHVKDDDAEEEEEEKVQQVNVTFARQKTEAAQRKQEQSFQEHSKKSNEEQWIKTTYRSENSNQAELTRLDMFCSKPDARANSLNLSPKEYFNVLAPRPKPDTYIQKATVNDHNSLAFIRTLPLLDQVRSLMKNARVISFSQLRTLIKKEHDTTTILKYLQQVAALVHGNWVVNSDVLWPKDTLSFENGIPADLMCRARDYTILTFMDNEYVTRAQVSSVISLPSDEIQEIFEGLGIRTPGKGWQLLQPPDEDFPRRFPDIAQRQELLWENKRKSWKEMMEAPSHPPQRQRRRSNRDSIGSENEERNIGRGRHRQRDSSISDDGSGEPAKGKKVNKSRKASETA